MSDTGPDEPLVEELASFAPNDATALADLAERLASILDDPSRADRDALDLDAIWREVEAHLDGPSSDKQI